MTNMFKKSLLATALMATAGVANAALLNPSGTTSQTPPLVVTTQYLAGNDATTPSVSASIIDAGVLVVELGAEYSNDDTITLTFTAPLAADMVSAITSYVAASGGNQVTLGLINGGAVGDTTATYRVTSRLNTSTVIGAKFHFGGQTKTDANNSVITPSVTDNPANIIRFTKSAVTNGVKVSFAAKTNNQLDLDTTGGDRRTAELVKVVDQFVKKAPSFSRVVDVEQQRRKFVDSAVAGENFLVIGTVELSTATANATRALAATDTVTVTINGDFSWVKDQNTNAPNIQPATGTIIPRCGLTDQSTYTLTSTSLSFKCNGLGNASVVMAPEAQRVTTGSNIWNPVLPTQDFTATVAVAFTGPVGSENVFNSTAAGSWTLNGSNVYIPYMLYGATAEQTIQLTNKGSQTGDIFATAIVNGERKELGKVGVANARSLTSLNAAIRNAMIAQGIPARTGAFAAAIELTTNVPEADVTVYSAYQRGADRLIVVNDSNGK